MARREGGPGGRRWSRSRWAVLGLGVVVWSGGLWLLASGSDALGGAVMLVGGLLIVLAASGGWDRWLEAVSHWLYWR